MNYYLLNRAFPGLKVDCLEFYVKYRADRNVIYPMAVQREATEEPKPNLGFFACPYGNQPREQMQGHPMGGPCENNILDFKF